MPLYDHNFQLLPIPARTSLSIGPENTRARLPDVSSVSELSEFVHRLVYLQLDHDALGFWPQVKLSLALVCFLIVVVFLIFIRRMYDHSFWIVRLLKRPKGTIIIPNSFLSFSLIEGIYGILWILLMAMLLQWYHWESKPPTNYPLWILLSWCPLICGAIWAAWGTYFAIPGKLNFSDGSRSSIHRICVHPMFVNALGLFIPIVILATILILSLIANPSFNKAIHMEVVWQQKYSKLPLLSQDMAIDAQRVWYEMLHSRKIISITFCVWTVFAMTMMITYTTLSLRLIFGVRKQLVKARKSMAKNGATSIVTRRVEDDRNFSTVAQKHPVAYDIERTGAKIEFPSTFSSPTSQQTAFNRSTPPLKNHTYLAPSGVTHVQQRMEGSIDIHSPDPKLKSEEIFPRTEVEQSLENHESNEEVQKSKADGFFKQPRLPNFVLPQPRSTSGLQHITQYERTRELRKAFVHICIHCAALCPACLCFAAIAAYQAASIYGRFEQPRGLGNYHEKDFATIVLFAGYATVVFGTITLVAIAQRAYEPVFSSILGTSGTSTGGASASHSDSSKSHGHTRRSSKILLAAPFRLVGGRTVSRSKRKRNSIPLPHITTTFFETHSRTVEDMSQEEARIVGTLDNRRKDDGFPNKVSEPTTRGEIHNHHGPQKISETAETFALSPSRASPHDMEDDGDDEDRRSVSSTSSDNGATYFKGGVWRTRQGINRKSRV